MSNTWPLQRDVSAFYGNPDADRNGEADRAWEDENLVRIVPPWQMVLAWDVSSPVKNFRVHRLCAASIARVLGVIWAHAGASQNAIEEMRMHLFGGAYNFRLMRGGNRLSMHSYGCAIDLDPERNPFRQMWRPNAGMMPQAIVDAFAGEGWVFGGNWSTPDAMHFQAARVG